MLSLRRFLLLVMISSVLLGCGDGSDPDPAPVPTDTQIEDTTTMPDGSSDSSSPQPDLIEDTNVQDTQQDVEEDMPPPPDPVTGDWQVIPFTEAGADVDSVNGVDPTVVAGDGEARVGRIAALPSRFPGTDGRCRVGDYRLYNNQVAFCIEGPTPATVHLRGGGTLIDAIPLNPPGVHDGLYLLTPDLGLRVPNNAQVDVVRDGSDGGMAVLRVTGQDDFLNLILGILNSTVLAPQGEGFEVITEYRLAPNTAVLELVTWVSHPERTETYGRASGDLFLLGDETQIFFAGKGLINEDNSTPPADRRFAVIAPNLSYAFEGPDDGNVLYAGIANSVIGPGIQHTQGVIPPGAQGAFRRHLSVTSGSSLTARAAIEAHLQSDVVRTETTLTVLEDITNEPISGLTFQVIETTQDTPVGAAITNAMGQAEIPLPPGDYRLVFEAWDGPAIPDTPFTVSDTPDTVNVSAPQAARLEINIDELDAMGDMQTNLPAKILLTGPVSRRIQSMNGRENLRVPPGDYDVRVTRGMEYTAFSTNETVSIGTPTVLNVTLEHILPTPERVCGEFHQHATPSPDSRVSIVDRVLSNLTDSVDFMAPSDHEALYEYNDVITELGLGSQLYSLNGTEVSPQWGHVNGIGLPLDPAKPEFGALPLVIEDPEDGQPRQRTPLEIVRGLKEIGALFIQLNHGRVASQAILTHVGYDPAVGPFDDPDHEFILDIDMLEIFNGRDATCTLMRDWYSFLNHGMRVIVVGNSDTHTLNSPAGFPRNYIGGAGDDPATLDRDRLGAAIATGDVTIAGGALITVDSAWRPGLTRSVTAGTPQTIPLKIESPPWSRITTLLVIVNGEVVDTLNFDPAEADIVDFDGSVTVTFNRDAHVHFIAYGTEQMSAVYTNDAPYSVTNPLYIDVDGDMDGDGDVFDPPGNSIPLGAADYAFCNL